MAHILVRFCKKNPGALGSLESSTCLFVLGLLASTCQLWLSCSEPTLECGKLARECLVSTQIVREYMESRDPPPGYWPLAAMDLLNQATLALEEDDDPRLLPARLSDLCRLKPDPLHLGFLANRLVQKSL